VGLAQTYVVVQLQVRQHLDPFPGICPSDKSIFFAE
jgi:hypothetical protein